MTEIVTTMTDQEDALYRRAWGSSGTGLSCCWIGVLMNENDMNENDTIGVKRASQYMPDPKPKRYKTANGTRSLTSSQQKAVTAQCALLNDFYRSRIDLEAVNRGEHGALRSLANCLVVVDNSAYDTYPRLMHGGGTLCPPQSSVCVCGKKHLKKVTIVAATSIAARSEREAIVLGSVCVEFFKFNGNETSTLCRSMERTKPRAH